MAQKVKIILIDDIDGGEADETVRFGLDGVQYEIDLSEAHASELREALAAYVGAARRSNQTKQRSSSAGAPSASRNQEAAQIREWAKENGYNVSSRGRVNSEIVEAYRAAQR
ncbi:Lsr2 dimerization domain-containing protein [Arthrobacter bussei]|uniref:Lsr2 family protein n=1 Tax=Arthrobacter bussei TaxID=2594179 RepID=A0A7X1NSG2_9MICC|nr:Lsr2 family protein [Arthrobacter bussei]